MKNEKCVHNPRCIFHASRELTSRSGVDTSDMLCYGLIIEVSWGEDSIILSNFLQGAYTTLMTSILLNLSGEVNKDDYIWQMVTILP